MRQQLNSRLPVAEIVLCRALISIVLTCCRSAPGRGLPGAIDGAAGGAGVLGSLALLCFFKAIDQLPLASATVLQYTYFTFTAAALLLLGEPLRRRISAAVLLAGSASPSSCNRSGSREQPNLRN